MRVVHIDEINAWRVNVDREEVQGLTPGTKQSERWGRVVLQNVKDGGIVTGWIPYPSLINDCYFQGIELFWGLTLLPSSINLQSRMRQITDLKRVAVEGKSWIIVQIRHSGEVRGHGQRREQKVLQVNINASLCQSGNLPGLHAHN